jgi:hypothetical protein
MPRFSGLFLWRNGQISDGQLLKCLLLSALVIVKAYKQKRIVQLFVIRDSPVIFFVLIRLPTFANANNHK